MTPSKTEVDAAHAAHVREQARWLADVTTPEYRFRWIRRAMSTFRDAHVREVQRRCAEERSKWESTQAQK
jgi:hypothetical protein